MTIQVTHTHGERIAVSSGGVELLSYVYRPDPDPFESRKPYIHPLRTLTGNLVSGYRPNDHRWHKGLQMTASHLSEQNFWGGNSYLGPEVGYQRVDDRVGSMRHDGFSAVESTDERLDIAEDLTWVENGGAEWARERRGVSVHAVDAASGSYAIDWSIDLTNVRDAPLAFGSPTTAGREMAGYTGLQWRGPRDFTGGAVLGPEEGQEGQELMGTQGPWLAFSTSHDDVDAHSTLVFAHAPENLDEERAVHASHWFVRSTPIPTVAFSWAFFEEFELAPGDSFAFRYRVLVADGAWDRERIAARLGELPW
ncbi:Methane oxygenase PmoA [Streptomyces zhaozhouensis]|uniref:Methane oxygenase PmoA n=1 Tax=Streptomyces zhaozhouensis TaxID=1300267 RepID=A0A286DXK1_9ACTN|nr:PmoA family protein [Streptomyces zhaozhouensis]SOD63398.1 Methane oxygenase PmoA [Streptomyces zhaozhouensis]